MTSGLTTIKATLANLKLVALGAVLLLVGCERLSLSDPSESAEGAQDQVPLTVLTRSATWEDNVPETVICFGRLIPAREEDLRFGRRGRVETVAVTEGDRVESGADIARLEQGMLEEQRRVLQADVDRIRSALPVTPQPELLSMRQQLQQGEAQLRAVETELSRGIITAPFLGIVAECRIAPEDGVIPSMTAVRLVEDAPPLVEISADSATSDTLGEDQTVWVGIESTARAARLIQRSALRGPTVGERLALEFTEELPPDSWSYGDVVEARFLKSTEDSGIRVPFTALLRDQEDAWYVYAAAPVIETDRTTHRIIRRGIRIQRLIEDEALVTGDITAGDRVVIGGTHRIVPGQRVTVLAESDALSATVPVEPSE